MRAWVAVVMVLLVVAGCSLQPDAKESRVNLDESRAAVTKEVKDAARVLAPGNWEISRLKGSFSTCGSAGLGPATVEYRAGGRVVGSEGTPAERIRAATQMLDDAGWEVTDQGATSKGGEYSRLTRNGLALGIDGPQVEGSQDIGFGVSGECVSVTDEQFANLPNDEAIVP